MSRYGRRQALGIAAIMSLAPVLASRAAFAQPFARRGFRPPEGAMVLRRTLVRELMDGAAITVTRDWSVEFTATGRGYLLHGKQVAAKVDAPDNLAQLAALEAQRVEESQFPMALDSSGAIIRDRTATAATLPQAEVEQAIALATARIAPHDGSGFGTSYLATLASSAQTLISDAPRDLFFPYETRWESSRAIALPDGGSGEVAVLFRATLTSGGTIMREARREVVTRIADSQRVSREDWALQPA